MLSRFYLSFSLLQDVEVNCTVMSLEPLANIRALEVVVLNLYLHKSLCTPILNWSFDIVLATSYLCA